MKFRAFFKIMFSLSLLAWAFATMKQPEPWFSFLDDANLLFHEAGHIFFLPFGETGSFLGGTILQLTIPFGICLYFGIKREWYSCSIMIFWLGQNLFGVARYVGDARAQVIPLLGGEHDWAFLLGQWNLLPYDTLISHSLLTLAWLLIIGATLLGIFTAISDTKKTSATNHTKFLNTPFASSNRN